MQMMKRAFINLHQYRSTDGEARAKLKHQTLLQEYLQLQKDFVSKKRKLLTVRQKRDVLLPEVRFLRQRYKYLLKTQSPKIEGGKSLAQSRNSDIPEKMLERPRHLSVSEAALENPYAGTEQREQKSSKFYGID